MISIAVATIQMSTAPRPSRWNNPCEGPATVATRHAADTIPLSTEARAHARRPARASGTDASSGVAARVM